MKRSQKNGISIHIEFDVGKNYIHRNSVQSGEQEKIKTQVTIVWDICYLVALGPYWCAQLRLTAIIAVSLVNDIQTKKGYAIMKTLWT